VTGPTGALVEAAWGIRGDAAVVESAEAIGLALVAGDNDPLRTTTRGAGELMRVALEAGAGQVIVGVGGSATVDGGLGALEALDFDLRGADVVVACDVETRFVDVKGPQEFDAALARIGRTTGEALFVPGGDLVFFMNRAALVAGTLKYRVPAMFTGREFADAGGLMSYSARLTDQFRRAAGYVARVLRGARPGELPVEQPTSFELVVNLKTATALELTLPPAFLLRADEVLK